MEEQKGDENPVGFSYLDIPLPKKQKSCWITYTNPTVHEILKTGFDRSPMFAGRIDGVGPLYCPSIEDKLNRFAEKERHQLFIEPEGWNTVEIYVNGFSTSLPEEVQYEALRNIPGFQNSKHSDPVMPSNTIIFLPHNFSKPGEKIIANLFLEADQWYTGYE
jgi:tRNA uridine 5-carboxymethylaminomethyl modification enzyme